MKQSVLAITTVILLLGGVVTVALIQNAEAAGINTTRSNIKHVAKKKEVKGNDNQVSEQDSNVGDGTECSGLATKTNGDVQSQKSEVTLDTSISVDGDSNVFSDSDPIPGVDVKARTSEDKISHLFCGLQQCEKNDLHCSSLYSECVLIIASYLHESRNT